MNWIRRIGKLLGTFWSRMVADQDIILLVENLVGMFASRQQAANDRWFAGKVLPSNGKYQECIPFVLLLKKTAVSSTSGHPARPLLDVLLGRCGAGTLDQDGGIVLHSMHAFPKPMMLTDHVLDASHTLFLGVDYDYDADNTITIYADPEELGWPEVMREHDGELSTYYRVFGWAEAANAVNDAVSSFESPELADCADVAWSVHQNGATVLSAKELLGSAFGSVVCEADGVVQDIWTENGTGLNCAIVASVRNSNDTGYKFYKSKARLADGIAIGSSVAAGDTIFGDMACFPRRSSVQNAPCTWEPPQASEVPGIHVMTDAGELFAPNDTRQAVSVNGINVLPLTSSQGAERVSDYRARCAELAAAHARQVSVPTTVNPCRFILDTLRNSCYLIVVASVQSVRKASAALSCLRKSMPVHGMVSVYLRAEGEPVNVAMTCGQASAVRAAVATCCSMSVAVSASRARVFL